MNEVTKSSWIIRVEKWFDPRGRSIDMIGFILNRITALGLTLYLFLHLLMLGNLVRGAEAYNSFITLMKNPIFISGEVLVIAAGFIHGLNGIRVALNSLGIGVRYQRVMLMIILVIALMGSLYFAIHMLQG
jgi:succinate dehydrogenase / fumarate reductase, cytochrome b subunit